MLHRTLAEDSLHAAPGAMPSPSTMKSPTPLTRRQFLAGGVAVAAVSACSQVLMATNAGRPEPIIDIHQHVPYSKRNAEQLIAHQEALGIIMTVLLPAGSRFGLAAGVGSYREAKELAESHPERFRWFANEVTDQSDAAEVIRRQLRSGAIGIGEQKFDVASDSAAMEQIIHIAAEFDVPVLIHFQQGRYNHHLDRFHRVLEKFPKVNFIGHAQTFWGHISRDYDETELYPMGPVVPGGLTDRLLTDYPNIYADLSAGSGYRAFIRDEEHAKAFFSRHQDKLLYGSDCSDAIGRGPGCSGSLQLESVRRFAPNRRAERKILFWNARRLLKLA